MLKPSIQWDGMDGIGYNGMGWMRWDRIQWDGMDEMG